MLIASVFFSASASIRQSTIFDYYLKIPRQYLPSQTSQTSNSREDREAAIWIKDLDNAYLQVRRQTDEIYDALTLFRQPGASDLIAIESRACIRGCTSKLTLLKYERDQWIDVTSEMLPVIDDRTIIAGVGRQVELKPTFTPRVLYTLPRGGSTIEVSDHWSGSRIGELEWSDGKFAFKSVTPEEMAGRRRVLASIDNSAGDRLEIVGINPWLPAKLSLKGHLRVTIAYQLKSKPRCLLWVRPVITETRLPDSFAHGSLFNKRGSGFVTGYFGFNNEAQLNQIRVRMADEDFETILSLVYTINASWHGTLECPTFRVYCYSNSPDSAIPVVCGAKPSGLHQNQRLTYNWSLSNGVITSGQSTHAIRIDTSGEENVTAMLEVAGLPSDCSTKASFSSTAKTVVRPSK
jgi:hypothetical protein